MIRPFNLRDLALVRRLGERGGLSHLYTEAALTDVVHPWRSALLSLVGGDFPTYVWKAKESDDAGFVQLHLEQDGHHAHILCLASTACENEDQPTADGNDSAINEHVWLPLLEQAVIDIGRRGIHSLVAEVDEVGDELPTLRRAGFAVYTRQDIWVSGGVDHQEQLDLLRPRRPADDWDVQLLYANTVPRLVQLVEPMPPTEPGDGWVLREGDELAAFVHVHTGSMATWMRFFIHPNAHAQGEEIITAALQVVPRRSAHMIYCCVRRYQSWLQGPMERTGFELWASQAVMVKHTVQHLQKPMPELATALDAQGIPVSAPIVGTDGRRYHLPRNGKQRHKA